MGGLPRTGSPALQSLADLLSATPRTSIDPRQTILGEILLPGLSKGAIVSAIQRRIGLVRPSFWRIGLTHDPYTRKNEWRQTENVNHWTHWKCASLADAQDIEASFIWLGMKGGTGGNLSAGRDVYVYVF